MGAGKSTVGPLLARALGAEFVDLDAALERETGMRIAEIFRSRGEATFRRLEADLVRRLVGHEARGVFALGGGTVEDVETRAFLLERGVLVTLTAPVEELVARASREDHGVIHRPLLAGDAPALALARIVERRAEAYAEAHRVIDTSQLPPAEVAHAVAARLGRDEASVVVRLGRRSHRVVILDGALRALEDELAALAPSRIVLVTDANVRGIAERSIAPAASLAPLEPRGARAWRGREDARVGRARVGRGARRGGRPRRGGRGVRRRRRGDGAGFAAATLLRGLRVV
ncbi:MAG: hypothetical protein IPN34_27680 [Planctomycetes bacterium]|nr:hypothetical protein [Planctomycetota bacterium]